MVWPGSGYDQSRPCNPGEAFIKMAILLLGNIFIILMSCDLISFMAETEIGVIFATLHCIM